MVMEQVSPEGKGHVDPPLSSLILLTISMQSTILSLMIFTKNFFARLSSACLFFLFVFQLFTVPYSTIPGVSLIAWAAELPQPFGAILPKDAHELIQKNSGNPGFVLIDIRTPEEFMSGYIEGAVNINYHDNDFIEKLDKLDKNKTYLIYCRTGRRSSDTLNVMKRLKFNEVYRILGDIVRWKAEKLPLVK
jgi:rhodanese-related sulfurtransferase